MSDLYQLTDEQMARLKPYFPKNYDKPRVDGRRVLSGIVFVNRNGLRWCDAPRECGRHALKPVEAVGRKGGIPPLMDWLPRAPRPRRS